MEGEKSEVRSCKAAPDRQDDEKEAWMGEGEFRAELRYRMSLSVAKALLENGTISKEEYLEIDNFLLQRHRPAISTLLAGKPLE